VCAKEWFYGANKWIKTSTSVLFDKDKQFVTFGFEAEDKYSELAIDNRHGEYYLFRNFKMQLYDKMVICVLCMFVGLNCMSS